MINTPIVIVVCVAIIVIGYYGIILTRKPRPTQRLTGRRVKGLSLLGTGTTKLKSDSRRNDKVAFAETSNVSEDSFICRLKKSRLTGPIGLVLALCTPTILFSVSWRFSFLAVICFVLSLMLSWIAAFKGPKGVSKVLSILSFIILFIHTVSAAAMFLFGYLMVRAY